MITLKRNQTEVASKFYVAGELSRLGYNVAITAGNIQDIDIMIGKDKKTKAVKVLGIPNSKSVNWDFTTTALSEDIIYIFVNLNDDKIKEKPEFFVLSLRDISNLLVNTLNSEKTMVYLEYKTLQKYKTYQNAWGKLFYDYFELDYCVPC